MPALGIFTPHGVNSYAREDYWLVISGDPGSAEDLRRELSRLGSK